MHSTGHLFEIVILLSAAVAIVAIFRMLRLSPVLGYLVAGAAIGPYGIGVVTDIETTSVIAEYGVVFLLFLIGLELSLNRLRAMRVYVFGLGTLQLVLTTALISWVVHRMGVSMEGALIIGGGLALSSTAVVLQVIEEMGEKSSQVGRLSLAVLIMQDLAVVPLLVLVQLLEKPNQSLLAAVTDASAKAVIALIAIFIVGRLILRPLFRLIASLHNEEIFVAATLLIVLGTAWITQEAGLSLALGAFVAGLLVAETEYQHQVEADILPFKSLFLGLFFMTVGMSVDLKFLGSQFTYILALTLALILFKAFVIATLSRLFRFSIAASIHAGLLLCQGGEFGFVLFNMAAANGLIDRETSQVLLVVVTFSMAVTPLLSILGKMLANTIERRRSPMPQTVSKELSDLEDHTIIAGFGRMGQLVAKLLAAENINFVALDLSPQDVASGRRRGKPVYYGDASRLDVLKAVGITRAKSAVVTFRDTAMCERTVRAIRRAYPELPIISRAHDMREARRMEQVGANVAVPEVFEGSLQLGGALLKELGIAEHEVNRIIDVFRDRNYALSRNEEGPPALPPESAPTS